MGRATYSSKSEGSAVFVVNLVDVLVEALVVEQPMGLFKEVGSAPAQMKGRGAAHPVVPSVFQEGEKQNLESDGLERRERDLPSRHPDAACEGFEREDLRSQSSAPIAYLRGARGNARTWGSSMVKWSHSTAFVHFHCCAAVGTLVCEANEGGAGQLPNFVPKESCENAPAAASIAESSSSGR